MSKIVVGSDGSEGARAALRWAVDEARHREAAVEVITAWQHPGLLPLSAMADLDRERLEKEALHIAESTVDAVLTGGDRDVVVVPRAVIGHPSHVLCREAADADLLVLGSRGLGGFKGLLLGSVTQQCAHYAHCPVVIVPHAG